MPKKETKLAVRTDPQKLTTIFVRFRVWKWRFIRSKIWTIPSFPTDQRLRRSSRLNRPMPGELFFNLLLNLFLLQQHYCILP